MLKDASLIRNERELEKFEKFILKIFLNWKIKRKSLINRK